LEAAGLAVTLGCQRSGFAGDRELGLRPVLAIGAPRERVRGEGHRDRTARVI